MATRKKAQSKGGRPRVPVSKQQRRWLQVRIDDDLDKLIDRRVAELQAQGVKVDRSRLSRQLLRQGLADDSAVRVVAETLGEVRAITERVIKRMLLRELPERVASAIDHEMQQST